MVGRRKLHSGVTVQGKSLDEAARLLHHLLIDLDNDDGRLMLDQLLTRRLYDLSTDWAFQLRLSIAAMVQAHTILQMAIGSEATLPCCVCSGLGSAMKSLIRVLVSERTEQVNDDQ